MRIPGIDEILAVHFPDYDLDPMDNGGKAATTLNIPVEIIKGVFKGSIGIPTVGGYYYFIGIKFGFFPGTTIEIIRGFDTDYYKAVAPGTPLKLIRKNPPNKDATGRLIAVGKLATYKNKICMVLSTTSCGKVCISYMTRRGRKTDVVPPTQLIGIEELDTAKLRTDLTVQFLTSAT